MKDTNHIRQSGFVEGGLQLVLRSEGLALLVSALVAYTSLKGHWGVFALCFLLPDVSFAAYVLGAKAGTAAYNALHSTVGPLALGILGGPAVWPYALIWLAHIGFDRAVGYGLKYSSAFGDTHLGRMGKAPQTRDANPA